DSMSFQTIWFCEDSLGTTGISGPPEIINDSGSLSISQPTLPDAACSITVVLYRQLVSSEPALSSGFGLGHITKGIQRRHLGFYSTP
ncbi:MAG: hypothetical protein OEX12_13035, partial [Gammaproteobacteria bacterium]|nr:hypothetical protein [Gammaproteobacteria bacterium]